MAIKLKFRRSNKTKKRMKKNTVNMPINLDDSTLSFVEDFARRSNLSLNQAIVMLLIRWMKGKTKRNRSRRKKYARV